MRNTKALLKPFYPRSASKNVSRLKPKRKQIHVPRKKSLPWSNKQKKKPGPRSRPNLDSRPKQKLQQTQHPSPNLRPLQPPKISRPWSKRRRKKQLRKQELLQKRQRKKPKNNSESRSTKVQWPKSNLLARQLRKKLPNSKPRLKHKLQRLRPSEFVQKRKQQHEQLKTRHDV